MSEPNNPPTNFSEQSRPFQFSLKQLLMLPVGLGLFLGTFIWWYPFSIPAIPALLIAVLFFAWLSRSFLVTIFMSAVVFAIFSALGQGCIDPREYARQSNCVNNIKQIGLGLHNYYDQHGHFPPAYIADKHGRPMHSWRVLILPNMEYDELYKKYSMDEPWDGPNNRKLWNEKVPEYECPEQPDRGKNATSYLAVTGSGTMWQGENSTRIEDIRDGTANTIMIVESDNSGIHWMEPRDLDISTMPMSVNSPNSPGISSLHRAVNWQRQRLGANAGMADGSVRLLPTNISAEILKSLLTVNGGEKADAEEEKNRSTGK
jgi:hypothetical protein